MPTGDAYSSGHLFPSLWDLHMFYLLRPILFPNLSLFFRTMLFEYPSVLSRFCFSKCRVINGEYIVKISRGILLRYKIGCYFCLWKKKLNRRKKGPKYYINHIYSFAFPSFSNLFKSNTFCGA